MLQLTGFSMIECPVFEVFAAMLILESPVDFLNLEFGGRRQLPMPDHQFPRLVDPRRLVDEM